MGLLDDIKKDIEKTIIDYTFVPGKDIIETDDTIIVRIELAGIKEENIELNITDTKLKVKAELEEEIKGNQPRLIRRTVRFPKKVIAKEAEAEFKNGRLTVEIPKLEKYSHSPNISFNKYHKDNEDNSTDENKDEPIVKSSLNSQERKIKLLIQQLASNSSTERNNAVSRLVKMGEPAFQLVLESSTMSYNEVIKRKTCDYFGIKGDPRGVEPLIRLLKDPDRYVRSRAANALINLGDERAVMPLINALNDSKSKVRYRAVKSLGSIGDERAVNYLKICLDDNNYTVSEAAAEALKKFGTQGEHALEYHDKKREKKQEEEKLISDIQKKRIDNAKREKELSRQREKELVLQREHKQKVDKGLIKEVKGFNGQLELYDHKIIIKRKGNWAFIGHGWKGDKEILIKHISSIQFKKNGFATRGYIQFAFIGGIENKRGIFDATHDENSIMFDLNQEKDFGKIKEMIESKILESQGIIQNKPKDSNLNELEKLAELRDKEIITEEEFQAKKKQILGL